MHSSRYYHVNVLKIADDQQKPTFMFSGLPINKMSITGRLLKNDFPLWVYIGDYQNSSYVGYAKGNGMK